MNKTPEHLGGHLNRTNTDEPLLRYVKERFKIETMLDIGCGPGGMKDVANGMGIDWYGVCLLYTSPSPRDPKTSRMPSSA